MNAFFQFQWQTKEGYIGQTWTEDVYEANEILKEQFKQKHQSLHVFIVSKDFEIMEMEIYYDALKGAFG